MTPEEKRERKRESNLRYSRSSKGKERQKRYERRPEVKAKRCIRNLQYRQSQKGKEYWKLYRKRPDVVTKNRERNHLYYWSQKGIERRRRYQQCPEVRERATTQKRGLRNCMLEIPDILRSAAAIDALKIGIRKAADGNVT